MHLVVGGAASRVGKNSMTMIRRRRGAHHHVVCDDYRTRAAANWDGAPTVIRINRIKLQQKPTFRHQQQQQQRCGGLITMNINIHHPARSARGELSVGWITTLGNSAVEAEFTWKFEQDLCDSLGVAESGRIYGTGRPDRGTSGS